MACKEFYTIEKGDTLYKIAQKFNTTVANLLMLNPDIDENNLSIGEKICVISQTFQPVSCPIGAIAYNVNEGDTLSSIAKKFNTTLESLRLTNPYVDPYNLQIGQRICIFQNITDYPECENQNYYIVQKGDTLSSIANIYDVSVRQILFLNRGINPRNLQVGDIICLPVTSLPLEILINISAKRLTLFKNGNIFREFIVATGKPQTPTPIGNFTIVNKQIDPGGPYGTRWLGLSEKGYGIHGTNDPSSIGTAASNGCIRMYNEDVETLFDLVGIGTPVRIVP